MSDKIPQIILTEADIFYTKSVGASSLGDYADAHLSTLNTCPSDCKKIACFQERIPEACVVYRDKIRELLNVSPKKES